MKKPPRHYAPGALLLHPQHPVENHQVPDLQWRDATLYSRQRGPSMGRSREQPASSLGRTKRCQIWKHCRHPLAQTLIVYKRTPNPPGAHWCKNSQACVTGLDTYSGLRGQGSAQHSIKTIHRNLSHDLFFLNDLVQGTVPILLILSHISRGTKYQQIVYGTKISGFNGLLGPPVISNSEGVKHKSNNKLPL